jgi:SAM-dependent methyltransferase
MSREITYRDYVGDQELMDAYSQYQQRYSRQIRESDKELISTISQLIRQGEGSRKVQLLDIGCSTGNFLAHCRNLLPDLALHGGDIVESIVDECRKNPSLDGIEFHKMDMLNLGNKEKFDIITANASLMFFNEEEFKLAVKNIAGAIKKGGYFVAFDYFHPFEQEIAITEVSAVHPKGLRFHFRGYSKVAAALEEAGLYKESFRPFDIQIDLPQSSDSKNINTFTRRTEDGKRLSFRGSLYQPWCFLTAKKL